MGKGIRALVLQTPVVLIAPALIVLVAPVRSPLQEPVRLGNQFDSDRVLQSILAQVRPTRALAPLPSLLAVALALSSSSPCCPRPAGPLPNPCLNPAVRSLVR